LYNNVEAHERSEEVMKDLEKISPAADETDQPLLKDEVHKAIHKLKKHKSPGSDGIVGEILQAGGDALEEEIFSIMKSVWDEEAIPEEWTKSIIVTIPKNGDLRECSNYRTISLINHLGKVLLNIILDRLQANVNPHLSEEQAGFRKDRSMVQQILILRLMAEKAWRKDKCIYNCFIDFQKAFDTIKHDRIWKV